MTPEYAEEFRIPLQALVAMVLGEPWVGTGGERKGRLSHPHAGLYGHLPFR